MRKIFSLFLFFIFLNSAVAQNNSCRFFTPSDTLNKKRVEFIGASWVGIYGGALVGLNQLWYANYPRSSFHFYNDIREWNQIDKCGHVFTAYFEAEWSARVLQWTGMKKNSAAWWGGMTGVLFQSVIETLDGFSKKWGFSPADMTANCLGSGICISQNLLWNEQKLQLKFSSHPVNYSTDLKARTEDLYGNTIPQKVLKDYNGQTYWFSANIFSFMKNKESKFPKWLNFSVGYGAEGMLGGYENKWLDENSNTVTRYDIPRSRQIYFSLDVDCSKIKTKSKLLNTFFHMTNIIKFPAPALEFNSTGKMKFYPIYF